MEEITFEQYVDVHKYLYDVDYLDIELDITYGIKIGILGYTSITGDAQELLKGCFNKNKVLKFKEIWDNFIKAENNFEASKWIYNRPASIQGILHPEYVEAIEALVARSVQKQKTDLNDNIKIRWEKICNSLNLDTPNLKALALARILRNPMSPIEIQKLALMSYKDKNRMIKELSPDARADSLLSPSTKHVPGKDLNPMREFPWLQVDTEEEKSE